MKRFLLLAALFATSASFAQWRNNGPDNNRQYGNNYNSSALVLTTASNQPFSVAIDGSYYQSNGNGVSVPNLSTGNHVVTVYENKRGIFGGNRQRQIYSATVYFKPGIEHNMYINQYGQASFDERSLYQNGNNGQYGNNGNGKGWGYGRMKDKHKKHKKNNECDDDRDDDRRGKW